MKKIELLTHCCNDCLMKEIVKGKATCIIKDPHFNPKELKTINDCLNWQN